MAASAVVGFIAVVLAVVVDLVGAALVAGEAFTVVVDLMGALITAALAVAALAASNTRARTFIPEVRPAVLHPAQATEVSVLPDNPRLARTVGRHPVLMMVPPLVPSRAPVQLHRIPAPAPALVLVPGTDRLLQVLHPDQAGEAGEPATQPELLPGR